MLLFPSLLIGPAKEAGMAVPELDHPNQHIKPADFPHFHVFCVLQLNRRMEHGEQYRNAITIAKMTANEVKEMTFAKARELGLYPQ